MPLRRSHPKSHHGCDRCKRRRVKCDEQHPACNNCVRLGQICNYQSSDGIKWAPVSAVHALVPVFPGVINDHVQFRTENTLTPLNARNPLDDIASAVPRLNISCEGVQLINNWFLSTIYTVTVDEASLRSSQLITTNAAKAHDFLLHGMMALSAFHLAVHSAMPLRTTLVQNAIRHHNYGLERFRHVISDINATNAPATITFSSLITIICFASGRAQPRDFTIAPVDELFQVFGLAKNWFIVLTEASKHLDLASFIRRMQKHHPAPTPLHPGKTALDRLEDLVTTTGESSITSEMDSCKVAIHLLRLVLHKLHVDRSNLSVVVEWGLKLPEEYRRLIRDQCPIALVILAYYSVALHYFNDIWWLKGWGRRVLLSVWHNLHPLWRPSIVWPMEIVGIE